jgi:hypothetical protein
VRRTVKGRPITGGPIDELPWLRRKIAVRRFRRALAEHGPVGQLVGITDDGHLIWDRDRAE